jgi:hypothetical protein
VAQALILLPSTFKGSHDVARRLVDLFPLAAPRRSSPIELSFKGRCALAFVMAHSVGYEAPWSFVGIVAQNDLAPGVRIVSRGGIGT